METAIKPNGRLIVEMPVRHGKSELISHWTPVWYLSLFPHHHVILTTYETDFAKSWGAKVRGSILEHGRMLDGLAVRSDSRAEGEFLVTGGGGLLSVGRGGAMIGRGANLLIGDDLLKNMEEANSPTIREKVWQWWDSTAMTRLEPGASAILLMTRWHEDDPPGRIKAAMDEGGEEWEVISLPAMAEGPADALGRLEGEALWPERWPLPALEAARRARGPYTWNALYQQRPQPLEGGLFRRSYLRHYQTQHEDEVFRLLLPGEQSRLVPFSAGVRFGTMDLAISTKTTADYTVTAAFQWVPPHLILLDLHRERIDFHDQLEAAWTMLERYGLDYMAVESTGYQAALAQAGGSRFRPVQAKSDKVSRAIPLETMMAQGNVYFPSTAPWLSDLIDELLHFPTAQHDDQVDALAYAALAAQQRLTPARARMIRA